MSAVLMQVIRTQLVRRGEGNDKLDPIRIITQYWSTDGELLAEVDPCSTAADWRHANVTAEQMASQLNNFDPDFVCGEPGCSIRGRHYHHAHQRP